MVAEAPLPIAEAVSLVLADLQDVRDALEHLSDLAADTPQLSRNLDTWAGLAKVLRNGIRQEVRAALEREVQV
jgi:hypothetical protein